MFSDKDLKKIGENYRANLELMQAAERDWNVRGSYRLKDHDYSRSGHYYFVTICTNGRMNRFGKIMDGEMRMNDAGRMVLDTWNELPERFPDVELDACVVMPDHFHGILYAVGAPLVGARQPSAGRAKISDQRATIKVAPTTSLGRFIGAFKSITTNKYIEGVNRHGWARFAGQLWQRNYHDRLIRTNETLERMREYIATNALREEVVSGAGR